MPALGLGAQGYSIVPVHVEASAVLTFVVVLFSRSTALVISVNSWPNLVLCIPS